MSGLVCHFLDILEETFRETLYIFWPHVTVAFEGDIIINSVDILLFHVAFTKLLGFYLKMGRLRHTIYH